MEPLEHTLARELFQFGDYEADKYKYEWDELPSKHKRYWIGMAKLAMKFVKDNT